MQVSASFLKYVNLVLLFTIKKNVETCSKNNHVKLKIEKKSSESIEQIHKISLK